MIDPCGKTKIRRNRAWRWKRIYSILRELTSTVLLAVIVTSIISPAMPASDGPAMSSGGATRSDLSGWEAPLSLDGQVVQVLNRITFGPRPGDIERVRKTGVDGFLDEQLHPERIDDSRIESRVAELPTLSMTSEELVETYPEPKKALKQGRAEPQRREESAVGPDKVSKSPDAAMSETSKGPSEADMQGPRRVITELAQEEVLRAVYSNRQLQEVMVQFWMNHFNIFAPKGADRWLTTSFERDTIRPRSLGRFEDLLVATAKSPAMLFYLDNWMSATPNPTYANNPDNRWRRSAPLGGRYRPLRRRGGFGTWRRFGDPMEPRPSLSRRPLPPGARPNKRGLNENYSREVMELHTLGVNGGYSQQDVVEVARCLTGWTIDRPRQGGGFVFDPHMHDFGEKIVLGHRIPGGGGAQDGLDVLHILAHHPSTARFISLKLCRRFVADEPPQALVERASQTFLHSDGEIRAVLKTILTSPEFNSQAAYRAKVKSPLELVASSMRALGAQTDAGLPLLQLIARMGQPMFQYQAPTGFPDRAGTWINSSALLMRMNFAMMLASNRIQGTQADLIQVPSGASGTGAEALLGELDRRLLEGSLALQTRETILHRVGANNLAAAATGSTEYYNSVFQLRAMPRRTAETADPSSSLTALVLASPEFQRR